MNKQAVQAMELFKKYKACKNESEKFCSLLKSGASIAQIFASRLDWVTWCMQNIPCQEWPNNWVIAFSTINPIYFGLMLSDKAPNANLYNANLENANLRYANLRYANLYNANLYNAKVSLNFDAPKGWINDKGILIRNKYND